MYLVRNHYEPLTLAYRRKPAQVFPAPHHSAGIMRIRQKENTAICLKRFERVKINAVTPFCINKERHIHNISSILFRCDTKWMIDRRHYHYVIAGFCEYIYHHPYSLYNPGYITEPFRFQFPAMQTLLPVYDRFAIIVRLTSVAQYRMLKTFAQSIDNKRRSGKIHIRHPGCQKVLTPESFFKNVGFYGAASTSLNNRVEIIFSHATRVSLNYFPRLCDISPHISSTFSNPIERRIVVSFTSIAFLSASARGPNIVLAG